jgi:hypothetical protein
MPSGGVACACAHLSESSRPSQHPASDSVAQRIYHDRRREYLVPNVFRHRNPGRKNLLSYWTTISAERRKGLLLSINKLAHHLLLVLHDLWRGTRKGKRRARVAFSY